jgi:hypothetical protein
VITGPYTTVSKNSNDMVYIKSESEKEKASSFRVVLLPYLKLNRKVLIYILNIETSTKIVR